MSFGKNLERLRKEFKVSQAEIGRVLGVTQQMISNYEKDCNEPNFAGLVKIAEYFGTSTDALLDHYPVSDEYVRSQISKKAHENKIVMPHNRTVRGLVQGSWNWTRTRGFEKRLVRSKVREGSMRTNP